MDRVEKTQEIQARLTAAMAPFEIEEQKAAAASTPVTGTPAHGDPALTRHLRPPGALPAEGFMSTCWRSGQCVSACPVQAIVIDPAVADGLPHIVARQSPCAICQDLACMKACPSGALAPVGDRTLIRIGLATVDPYRCLRAGRTDDCRLCVTQCPIGETAIAISAEGGVEVRPGCTGCGVCEKACPTEPASIWVEPA
jgi:ferredoxin-type protein NapG